jgi:hypothetical protein
MGLSMTSMAWRKTENRSSAARLSFAARARPATMVRMRQPTPRHVVARVLAAAILLCAACVSGAHAEGVTATGDTITFEGRIDNRSVAEFLRLLQDPAVTRLVIDSRGGLVAPALDMADAIHRRQLDVDVPEHCLSSCANYIFPAGRRKTLGWPGAVAWHGNMTHVLYLQQSGQSSWSEALMAEARQLARRETEFFRRVGMDGFLCWFGKIAPYDVDAFYYVAVQDLERFGVHGVTVREAGPVRTDAEGLRKIAVDWRGLEASRPTVRMGD